MTLARRTPLLRKTGLRPVSKKRQRQARDYEQAKGIVRERTGGVCEACSEGVFCDYELGRVTPK